MVVHNMINKNNKKYIISTHTHTHTHTFVECYYFLEYYQNISNMLHNIVDSHLTFT